MTRSTIALSLLVAGLAAVALGYGWGHSDGKAAAKAASDADTVQQLRTTLQASDDLAKRSAQASSSIRLATARLEQAQTQNLKDFRDELLATAPDRAGCVFPAGVMRGISAARDQAGAAAAHGIVDSVSPTTTSPAHDR